jgi:soluble lytic murein transglycosylase-like protein
MRRFLLSFALSIVLSVAGTTAPVRGEQQVYHFTDENGVSHYTNMPSDPRFKAVPGEARPPRSAGDSKSRPYEETIVKVAARHLVDPDLLRAVIKCESDFNHLAISRAGAQGLMQLMPDTARLVDVDNPFDAGENIEGGAKYLKYLLTSFDTVRLALAAYNAGEGAVRRAGGIPPYRETRNYVSAVLSQYERYRSLGADSDPITTADIQSFTNGEGTRLFTNTPWKYGQTSDWSKEEPR